MLEPASQVAQTGETPITGASLGEILRGVGWLTGQLGGTGPRGGTVGVGVGIMVTVLVGSWVLTGPAPGFPDEAQLASKRRHTTSNNMSLCMDIRAFSLHLLYVLASEQPFG